MRFMQRRGGQIPLQDRLTHDKRRLLVDPVESGLVDGRLAAGAAHAGSQTWCQMIASIGQHHNGWGLP